MPQESGALSCQDVSDVCPVGAQCSLDSTVAEALIKVCCVWRSFCVADARADDAALQRVGECSGDNQCEAKYESCDFDPTRTPVSVCCGRSSSALV